MSPPVRRIREDKRQVLHDRLDDAQLEFMQEVALLLSVDEDFKDVADGVNRPAGRLERR